MHRIYIKNRSLRLRTAAAYRFVCSFFTQVNAAGGLVSDGNGKFLMIKRNGVWDLPKGHQEPGEEISVTAIREVEEETGVKGLELGGLICITDHTYKRNGLHYLKHTWWYDMKAAAGTTVPQSEEGIEQAVWVDAAQARECLENSYPSIKEVFSNKI